MGGDDLTAPSEELSCSHDLFSDYGKVKEMILKVPSLVEATETANDLAKSSNINDSSQYASEKAFDDMKTTLDEYQSQPHLLDPHLEELLSLLLEYVRVAGKPSVSAQCYGETKAPCPLVASQAFKYLYLLIKVRGYKRVLNKLPHEVRDLLPVLEMIEQPRDDRRDFYNTYVLFLWLSIIVYMPFNIADFDATNKQTDEKTVTVLQRLLNIIKEELKSAQGTRDMAAFLASKLVTRPDLREKELPMFVHHCLEVLLADSSITTQREDLYHHLGALRALGLIWKHGRRDELLLLSPTVLEKISLYQKKAKRDSMTTKLIVKLLQRIGLTFLPPRIATWRYKRGNRSLSMNMSLTTQPQQLEGNEEMEDEDIDVHPSIESVIDLLLDGLKDGDTIVRYSCSKGIGRVCCRLPRDMAAEVVSVVLANFTPRDSHFTWHGSCLTLAELGRRGLLLPDTLPSVVAVLQKAFVYDKLMGQCSVGANIRDAACYLCWSLARAYDPHTLKEFVPQLAKGLLVVALFDREIPCRHAASAAFQEHVGRQGNFPHGIEILTTVDYFSVGIRANAYLKLSPFVASFGDYSEALVSHLVEHKLNHWDSAVRELAAKTLKELTKYCLEYCSKNILPALLTTARGSVLVSRHGAILALGNVVLALSEASKEGKTQYISEENLKSIFSLMSELSERKMLLGVGGTYMRLALADMFHNIAVSDIKIPKEVVDQWLRLLEESVLFVEDDVRLASVKGLTSVWNSFYSSEPSSTNNCVKVLPRETLDRYISTLNSERENYVHGMSLALGGFPNSLMQTYGSDLISALLKSCKITSTSATWAAARRDAISSIVSLLQKMCVSGCLTQEILDRVIETLLLCLEDYTTDRRGDVGAWVRESAITAISKIFTTWPDEADTLPQKSHIQKAISIILQLSVERIDRTRKVAGNSLVEILYSKGPCVELIPDYSDLTYIFKEGETVNWGDDDETFGIISCILSSKLYLPRLIMGYSYSIGGVSAKLAENASMGFVNHLENCSDEEAVLFLETLFDLMEDNSLKERLSLSFLKAIEYLMTATLMLDEKLEENANLTERMLARLKAECVACRDYNKLVSVSKTLCEMLRLQVDFCRPVLNQLLLFLGYQYPKVRTVTAASLVTALNDYSEELIEREVIESEEVLGKVLEVLETTPWIDADLPTVRQKRNECCELLGLPVPVSRAMPGTRPK